MGLFRTHSYRFNVMRAGKKRKIRHVESNHFTDHNYVIALSLQVVPDVSPPETNSQGLKTWTLQPNRCEFQCKICYLLNYDFGQVIKLSKPQFPHL